MGESRDKDRKSSRRRDDDRRRKDDRKDRKKSSRSRDDDRRRRDDDRKDRKKSSRSRDDDRRRKDDRKERRRRRSRSRSSSPSVDSAPEATAVNVSKETKEMTAEVAVAAAMPLGEETQANSAPSPGKKGTKKSRGKFGTSPMDLVCPRCHEQTQTRTVSTISCGTFWAILLLFLLFWPLCWLPLVMPDCKQTDHFCRLCHAKIGTKDCACCGNECC